MQRVQEEERANEEHRQSAIYGMHVLVIPLGSTARALYLIFVHTVSDVQVFFCSSTLLQPFPTLNTPKALLLYIGKSYPDPCSLKGVNEV